MISNDSEYDSLFLRPLDVQHIPVQPEYTLLQSTRMVRKLPLLCRRLPPGLTFYHDIEVNELLRQSGHIVFEAE